jgi:hypothetical protein
VITFFFTFKDIGGVQVLIFNVMKELFRNNILTKLIYHKDSWLTKELDKNHINYEFYNIENIHTPGLTDFISRDDILVTTIPFIELVYFREINPLFLLWNVSSFTLEYYNDSFAFIRRFTRGKLIKLMAKKKGLVFMDNEGVLFIEKMFETKINPQFLPVPISICDENKFSYRKQISCQKSINITYLGRAIDLKVNPVIKVISDINNCYPYDKKIILHIITDDTERFKRLMSDSTPNFEVRFYSDLSDNELRQFLIRSSDLHIAMGISCLEGSSLGIPSILVDPSTKRYPADYLYRWIFENENFCLGKTLDYSTVVTAGRSFSEILSYYDEDKADELSGISVKCYEYTKQNHDLQHIAREFYNSCINSNLKIKDVLFTDLSYYMIAMLKQSLFALWAKMSRDSRTIN